MIPHPVAERTYLASTSLFLLVAPFTSSAGWRAATLVVAMACAGYLALRDPARAPRPMPRALFLTLAAFCALAVASLAWSERPAFTAGELRGQVLYGALAFLGFYLGASPRHWRVWWRALLVATLVLFVAEGVREHFEPSFGVREWDGGGGAFSTHLAMVAPLLLPLAWNANDGERPRTILFVLATLTLFLAAWATENRIVWLAILAAFAAAAFARRYAHEVRPRFEGSRYFAVAGVAIIITLAAFTTVIRGGAIASGTSGAITAIEGDLRPRIWAVAVHEIEKAPLLGHGFGREIAAESFQRMPRPAVHPEILHAHNMFLDMAVQLGIVGLALFAAALVLLAREFVRALRVRETCAPAVLGLAVLAGFITKNMTDDFLYRHNGLVFWALMGLLLGLSRPRKPA
ncbi:hypothetical protein BWI17_05730 [Betaproteobacteria bacterium GR16-43]|nr:hypothetical protein BWI17_05730 [Betaproteobacteria bacterium GR16-43]